MSEKMSKLMIWKDLIMISIMRISMKESILPERLYLMKMAFIQNGHSLSTEYINRTYNYTTLKYD